MLRLANTLTAFCVSVMWKGSFRLKGTLWSSYCLAVSTKPLCVSFKPVFFFAAFCDIIKETRAGLAGNRGGKSHETVWWKLKTLPLARRHHLCYPPSLQLMWSDNVMISECSHSSGVAYEFAPKTHRLRFLSARRNTNTRRLLVLLSVWFDSDRVTYTHRLCLTS